MDNTIIKLDRQLTNKSLLTTRRMALENLVLFPASLFTAMQLSPHDDLVVEAFITQCAPCIMACSYLINGYEDDLTAVEQILPQYLPQLAKLAKSSSPFQKEAAYLATQGYCLMSTVKHHRLQFRERVANCKQAAPLAGASHHTQPCLRSIYATPPKAPTVANL